MTTYLPTKFAKRIKKHVCLRATLHQAFYLGSALDVLKLEMRFLSLFWGSFFSFMLLNDRLSTIEGLNSLTSILDRHLSGYASFIENRHHYLRIQNILHRDPVYDFFQCALNCLVTVRCRSFNLKLQAELDGKHLCELLASDKFNHSDSEGYEVSTEFHHYSIAVRFAFLAVLFQSILLIILNLFSVILVTIVIGGLGMFFCCF